MCFSAEASFGVSVGLLPVGAYCLESAWRKDRRYLPLAAIPVGFGVQQLCEGLVWVGFNRGDPDLVRGASLVFLFFALVVWPVWVPLACAALESRGWKRRLLVGLAGTGVLFGCFYYLPSAADGGRWLHPVVVGHSIRYDFSGVPAAQGLYWWAWPALYLAAVSCPFLVSRDRRLWPLGVVVVVLAVVAYLLFETAFASVWCFFAAGLSVYLAYDLHQLPGQPPTAVESRNPPPAPSPLTRQPVNRGSTTPETRTDHPLTNSSPAPTQEPFSLAARVGTLAAVILPLVGAGVAVASLWGWGFGWAEFGLLIGMYVLTALGITVGFHRLLTHRSFETNSVVRFVLAALGSMAVQGSVLRWVAQHRRHHQHSDTAADPHSPHHRGRGLLGVLRGFWHAHIGWAFKPDAAGLDRYVADLKKLTSVRVASALFPVWIALGLLIPAALGLALTGTWAGALLGFLWGGLVRVFLVHHVTWSVNSVCHLWGSRPYPEHDHSRNNLVLGVLALGEGWHNNHHAFPTSARHGLRWWQVDVSYYVIRMLALVGLAWKVRLPASVPVSA